MKGKAIKPTGSTGPLTVKVESDRLEITWNRLKFPNEKEKIERLIVDGFYRAAAAEQMIPAGELEFRQNPTDDFDFTMEGPLGRRYVELMEIAPLQACRGYDAASGSYRPYDLANFVLQGILAKSSRYAGAARNTPIWLLLYVTDWKFTPSESMVMLTQCLANRNAHAFERIFLYKPVDVDNGKAWWIHPTPAEHWVGFDPEDCRDAVVANLMPTYVRRDEDGHWAMGMGTAGGPPRRGGRDR